MMWGWLVMWVVVGLWISAVAGLSLAEFWLSGCGVALWLIAFKISKIQRDIRKFFYWSALGHKAEEQERMEQMADELSKQRVAKSPQRG